MNEIKTAHRWQDDEETHQPPLTSVCLKDLAVMAPIGINPEEFGRHQKLLLDVTVQVAPVVEDAIDATIDYRAIAAAAQGLCARHIGLIETFAYRLAAQLLRLRRVQAVEVTVVKPGALAEGIASVTVNLRAPHLTGAGEPASYPLQVSR